MPVRDYQPGQKRKPRPRKDGRCYVCRKPYKIAAPRSGVDPAEYVDPFCSNTCARAYFGVEDGA